MEKFPRVYKPIQGKTYTLFGAGDTTLTYYQTIEHLATTILGKYDNLISVIQTIQTYSSNKRLLRRIVTSIEDSTQISFILHKINNVLNQYTLNVEAHIKTLPILKIGDRGLRTTRLQYYLYMLEIELTNRLFAADFKNADKKIALLPYCLQDFSVNCKSVKNGFDYQCKHCSVRCFQNHASEILKNHQIEPYIWKAGDMKQLANYMTKEKKTFGVLGIACIPELIAGMRNCRKRNIPVVGIPLNANRCKRWFGEFFPNSIDLNELGKLVSD